MNLSLGIDTGGTYTDAVLVEHGTERVVASAKALTTRHDLSIGISGAVQAVFEAAAQQQTAVQPADVTLVALSTTLATNALAEGHRGAVCLLLIGYDRRLMAEWGFEQQLATPDVVYLRGGHDGLGNEVAPLDEDAARAAILARRDTVEAFAISGYFGVLNPTHELRVRALVEQLAGVPVTCGHELTTRLNAVRRATTVALNAHLILPLRELIAAVRRTLADQHIAAPLMIVKGDGSLVRAEWAMRRPIETILSGPAASVVGAWRLAGRRDMWAVDIGGTTTDIGALRDGWPILNPEGAQVAGWRTMIEAVDVHTVGLGGDSYVRWDGEAGIAIGPRRVVPLSLLASEHPAVTAELRRQARARTGSNKRLIAPGEFVVAGRTPGARLTDVEQEILRFLANGPRSIMAVAMETSAGHYYRQRIAELETRGLLRRSAFTPTDALHVLGRFCRWDREAAQLGAELLATQAGMAAEALCEEVAHGVARRAATALISKVLADEVGPEAWASEMTAQALLRRALDGHDGGDLGCALTLRRPLVAIGAPVAAYMPEVARRLNTELIIPPHAEVANAIGAVAGSVIHRQRVEISPLDGEARVRLHLPDGIHDFDGVDAAVAYAQAVVTPRVEALAREAGAEQVESQMVRHDRWATIGQERLDRAYLGTELLFSAAGRPSPARK